MRGWPLLLLLALGACATPGGSPGGSPGAGPEARPELRPAGLRLFHEVALTIPGRGEESLLGTLVFGDGGRFTLRGETPFGVQLFEVGHDGAALTAQVARPLRGKFDPMGLASGVWWIYRAGCPTGPTCDIDGGATLTDTHGGAPERLVRREVRTAGGGRAVITYEDWAPMQDVLHPRRISMRALDEGFAVEVLLSGFERL